MYNIYIYIANKTNSAPPLNILIDMENPTELYIISLLLEDLEGTRTAAPQISKPFEQKRIYSHIQ